MPTLTRPGHPALHYEIDDHTDPWSDAPVLILQHGNGRSARYWYRWVPYLSRYYRVVRPDLRGLGQSSANFDLERELSLDVLLADAMALLDHLGARQVHFCGESMGGILGLALAATHPDRVKSLTLVATPVFISDTMKSRYAMGAGSRVDAMKQLGIRAWVDATTRQTRLPADTHPDLFRWYVDEFSAGNQDVQLAMSALVNGANATGFLEHVACPVLGLYPTEGQITSAEQEALLKARLKRFEIVHLPTGFHMIHLLHARECAERTLRFCAGIDGIVTDEP